MNELAALVEVCASGGNPKPPLSACFEAGLQLDAAGQAALLGELDGHLRAHPAERMGPLALLAGAMLERGASPRAFPLAVFDRLVEFLELIPEEESEDEPYELPAAYELFERAAIACLSRSAELRATLPQRAALQARMQRYQERYSFLGKMLWLLEGELLLVIDLPRGRGWRFKASGIADNFQLHDLLLRALAGPGHDQIPGAKPVPGADSISSTWQLANWRALGSREALAPGHDHWIWNEGVPADIEPFEGTRVVLIAPTQLQRSWNAGSVFPWLEATLALQGPVPGPEVHALLERMLKAR